MGTLYVRSVDDDVIEKLKQRASTQGVSLSSYVNGALRTIAARPTNAEIAERLWRIPRDEAPTTQQILDAIQDGRR